MQILGICRRGTATMDSALSSAAPMNSLAQSRRACSRFGVPPSKAGDLANDGLSIKKIIRPHRSQPQAGPQRASRRRLRATWFRVSLRVATERTSPREAQRGSQTGIGSTRATAQPAGNDPARRGHRRCHRDRSARIRQRVSYWTVSTVCSALGIPRGLSLRVVETEGGCSAHPAEASTRTSQPLRPRSPNHGRTLRQKGRSPSSNSSSARCIIVPIARHEEVAKWKTK